jgi:uncharacterized protein (DUF433 family)
MRKAETCHIEKRPGVCGGKPCVAGTRIRVQDIYVWHEIEGQTPDEIVSRHRQLTLGDVHAALAYYWDHRAEIQKQIKAAERTAKGLRRKYPSKLLRKVLGKDAE